MSLENQWLDPLYLDTFLSEEERFIRESTKKFLPKQFNSNSSQE